MSQIAVKLPDGTVKMLDGDGSVADAAAKCCPDALVARLDGKLVDLSSSLHGGRELEFFTFDSKEGKEAFWHSSSHIMAQAVTELFPGTKLAIGPSIEHGFYYDFAAPQAFSEEDFARIEQRMKESIAADYKFERSELPKSQALSIFRDRGEDYKLELLQGIPDETVTLYRHNDFLDLCRGPHIPSTSPVKALKLLSVAGAYWRGDETKPMLQRIYAISFPSHQQLDDYLKMLKEAERRDHRRLGKELELFSFHEEAGAGFVFYHHKGALLRHIIETFLIEEHLKRGYQLAVTPHLLKAELWETSGHRAMGYPMFFATHESQEYGVKPMNCPGHMLIYKSRTRSYRDLPLRMFELGTVYRAERSGTLQGLLRVRGFTQDDAHIFCMPDQLEDEITGVIQFAGDMLGTFGFKDYSVFLSTRPQESIGSDDLWDKATAALRHALEANSLSYEIDPGAGVFYGPKLDIKLKDAIGRLWQGPTIQVDFNLPERFDLSYIDAQGKQQRPVMIHRVVLAGIERFLGVLIEHYAGLFPLWLSPIQVRVIPVSDDAQEYAREVMAELVHRHIRGELDDRRESVPYRVRQAEVEKIPVVLVVGKREAQVRSVSLRRTGKASAGNAVTTVDLHDLIELLSEEIETRR
jgi:threonyl-tRNA synthetase